MIDPAVTLGTAVIAIANVFLVIKTAGLVKVTQDTARRQLRAYVLLSKAKVDNGRIPNLRRAEIILRNFGSTPASKVRCWMGLDVREFPLTSGLREAGEDLWLSSDALGSDRESTLANAAPLQPSLESALLAGNAAVYAYGEARYMDIFGNACHTRFRYFCRGGDLDSGRMSPYKDGNSYD